MKNMFDMKSISLKTKIMVGLAAASIGLFLMIALSFAAIPAFAIDTVVTGVKEVGDNIGGFFESLGNFVTTGYWGSSEDVFVEVIDNKNKKYKQKGITIDIPLVVSAVYVGNTTATDSIGNCKVKEPTEDSKEEDTDLGIECDNANSQQTYTALRKEAVKLIDGMVNGDSLKSEEEYRKWLHDNFIEQKLKDINYKIPKDEKEKEKTFQNFIDQIYFNRDMYKSFLKEEDAPTGDGVCSYNAQGLENISDLKVRLLECDGSGPLTGEELIPFEKYVLGVTYQENGSAPDEAIKTQAIAARSFSLTRGPEMHYTQGIGQIKKEGKDWVLQLRACTDDQAYCNPELGCWSNEAGGEYKSTIHSGYDTSKYWSRSPIPTDSKLRTLVDSTAGQVLVDKNNQIVYTNYCDSPASQCPGKPGFQRDWNRWAAEGKTAIEILKKSYPEGVQITSNCTAGGDGSISGEPNFSNTAAWKPGLNPYAPKFYGQCTWFAWGRFYEIYGYSPGFVGDGSTCVSELLAAHGDKFVPSLSPKAGAVFSVPGYYGHVGIVVAVNGDKVTIQDGNYDGETNTWNDAIKDWQTNTKTLSELRLQYPGIYFANPKVPPKGVEE